ncbi:MAG: HAMP domain-containing protein [Betaproteobacteria bacterium]|nr:MAG: HAMP domain-containing protein [Betaproteobacteria bacterium]
MLLETLNSRRSRFLAASNDATPAGANPKKIGWLPPLVLLVNLAVLGLLIAYSFLNLLPDIPAAHAMHPRTYVQWAAAFAVLTPTAASLVFLWPVFAWLRRRTTALANATGGEIPAAIAERAANAPLALAAFSLLGWLLVTAFVVMRAATGGLEIPPGHTVHFISRPALAGLIAALASFFAAEHLCRAQVWPALLASTPIAGNRRLRRVRVWHRLLGLWLVISALPLAAVALTTFARVVGVDLAADPMLERLAHVVLLIAVSGAVGGAWFAWLVSRSIAGPLEALEAATARLSEGRFDTRMPVNATDEFGSLAEGFNLAAGRLSRSYAELETRNRELAEALDRVVFLEHVKRGLDRFVPETVRRAIEKNPEAPGLAKKVTDVTVLFLDIEGYSRLSEQLPRAALNALVERYFSLFMASIRAEGGDINETAGDGLMIIFKAGRPEEHACAAVRAALAIREQTGVANRDAVAGHPPIAVNIGINSGECDVGATRFKGPAGERWTFTASGPATNLAARLGDHANGGQILVAAETALRVRDRFVLRSLGLVSPKNLSSPVEAWEVEAGHQTVC